MTRFDWARVPLLAVMVLLLLSGGVALSSDGQSPAALVLLTAGMIVLGAWLAVEVASWRHRCQERRDDET